MVHRRKGKNREVYFYDFTINKVRYRDTVPPERGHTKQNALDYESEVRQSVLSGNYRRPASRMTMIQYAEETYLPWARENKKSSRDDALHIKTLRAFFGDRSFPEISRMLVKKFVKERRETPTNQGRKRAAASVNRELACLRAIFSHAIEDGLAGLNPCVKRRKEKGPALPENNERTRYLSADEEIRLLDACVGRRAYLRPIVMLAIQTGMRRKEILTLTWPQIDLARGIIRLPETKSDKPQEVVLNQAARAVLIELQGGPVGRQGYLFPGHPRKDGTKGCLGDVKKAFYGALRDAGLSDFHFHDLRHVTGIRLVETGAHPRVIQSILRHSSLKMTERYTNPQDTSKRDALDRMPNYWESGAECQRNAKKGGMR